RTTVALQPGTVGPLLAKWRAAHGEPKGLVVRRPADSRGYRDQPVEPDIGDYSFDRAVVCDRPETADILLAHNFHFENNCAVLAEGGYPERAFETVRAMLRKNPKIAVFALHDATPDGCALARRLRADEAWFRGIGEVVDVGLRPVHAKPFKGLW